MAGETNGPDGAPAATAGQPPAGTPAPTATDPAPPPPATDDADGDEAPAADRPSLEEARKLRAEARSLRQRLHQAEQQLRTVDEEKLSATERAERRAAEAEARLKETTDAFRAKVIRLAAEGAARDLRFRDPKLAVRLLDLAAVETDEAGEPTNLPALLKAELKTNPYLAEPAEPPPPAGPTPQLAQISPTPRPDPGHALTGAERDQRFAATLEEVRRAYG